MAEAVRLIIWDLDETFWRGTLTEGGIQEYRRDSHEAVLQLARRGIISTICSKNDYAAVKDILVREGIWNYFVFPSIDWTPKGQRVASLIETAQLRSASVLFIDDNPSNLAEAQALLPDLQVASEAVIPELRFMSGKEDVGLTRLGHYKTLERRHSAKATAGDNEDFLRESNIRVYIEYDIELYLDRAVELINRTNQLNFTKRRLSENKDIACEELREAIRGYMVQAGLVRVVDNYGDYGFVGFFLKKGGWGRFRLLHFCFSCRTLGMGIEQWVYDSLARPLIAIRGAVASDLGDTRRVDWITPVSDVDLDSRSEHAARFPSVRVRGGCDLEAVAHYFSTHADELVAELNFIRDGLSMRLDHSQALANTMAAIAPEDAARFHPLGFRPQDFKSDFFRDPPPRTVWIYSVPGDSKVALYRHRQTGMALPFASAVFSGIDLRQLTEEQIEEKRPALGDRITALHSAIDCLRAEFEYIGLIDRQTFQQQLKKIFESIPDDGIMYIVLQNDHTIEDGLPRYRPKTVRMNEWIEEVVSEFRNVRPIHLRQFVRHESEVDDGDHFSRMVYFRMFEYIRDAARGELFGQVAVAASMSVMQDA
jgi:FkbH-like protein